MNADAAEKVHAPWTQEQVASLNEYQRVGRFHEYTGPSGEVLVATTAGWVELSAVRPDDVVQTWAWKWTADWSWRDVLLPAGPIR